MVESYVKMKRKDYLKVCEMLERINSDLNMYECEDNKEIVEATRRKVSIAQNILLEEE